MFKKSIAMLLMVLLSQISIFANSTAVASNTVKEVEFSQKVKTNILKLGRGKDAKIRVKLHNKTKLAGHITETNENHFTITDDKTGLTSQVAYADVAQVKGKNLSTRTKIGIGVGIGIGAGLAIFGIYYLVLVANNG